jgi:hypothetical protein
MTFKALRGTLGVFTPIYGCRTITWSLSALVKIPLSRLRQRLGAKGDYGYR